MVKKIINNILAPRHFWRDADFDELSELYVSVMFRATALSLTGIFVPLYMLQLNYSITDVCILIACFFTVRIIADICSGFTVAKIGPKHTMLIGCLLQILSSILFIILAKVDVPFLLVGGVWGAAVSFYYIPFHVDFSKVKHKLHGGKELSYINIMERIGATLGPLVGGVVAWLFGAPFAFMLAAIILILSLIPLFRSSEPVRIKQKLEYKKFEVNKLLRDYFSFAALGIENTLSLLFWPLYLGVFVLATRSGYVKLGILMSISVAISILVSRAIGRSVDRRNGQRLLRVNATLNAALHIVRPFVMVYPSALAVNIANEAITVGYRLPFMKGMYDAADDLPGYRIVYLTSMECFASIFKASLWWILVLISTVLATRSFFALGFAIAAIASLLIMTERFKALQPNQSL